MDSKADSVHPSKVKAWIEAMRLRTLPVSISGVIAGIALGVYCNGSIRLLQAAICMLFAVMAQVVSNFANEYFDYRNGLDKKGREGFRRGVTEGDITPEAMKRATFGLLTLTCAVGLSLLFFGPWWLIIVGVAVGIFAMAYSAGPYPLSHHGLGDIAVIVFFGLVPVLFTAYLQCGSWHGLLTDGLLIGFGVGLLAANVLIVNNYRDADADAEVGKRTTVVILGRQLMRTVYLINGACAVLCAWLVLADISQWLGLVPVAVIVPVVIIYRRLGIMRGQALNKFLGLTAMTLLLYSLLLDVGLIVGCS